MIAFGPNDGYLYIGFGDDARSTNGQVRGTWLGKMLRIDVDVDPDPYVVPPTNPFVSDPDTLDEIWSLGLRNPWRWSFDRDTGDMYIGDVGSGTREEINYQPAASGGGENYAWNCMEGFLCTRHRDCICNSPTLTLPILDYDRDEGVCVIGGYVYRGQTIRDLRGTYFFADYGSSRVWSLRMVDGSVTEFENRSIELQPRGGPITYITSFGEDGAGELYLVSHDGGIFKIVPDGLALGDLNGDGMVNAGDIGPVIQALFDRAQYLINYPDIDPDVTGDINGDGVMNSLDIVPFIELLFN